ncbi:porin family protein [Flavobacterium phycosphaerae]|uniref:outer membrane beta-barrel protein n=1 Tax=Flavobacterium phycosphaerae TaxID=2697515 RepID=UPI001389D7A1|nr:outer membrane beta-barrel protein [Flavobacterium phycosphaerae]
MSERKNIDRLFQQKFNDFEALPAEETWSNIEARLNEKKKRRVIPFWWKLSGVAALFLLGFFVAKSIYSPSTKIENRIVIGAQSKPTDKSASPITSGNNSAKEQTTVPPVSTAIVNTSPAIENNNSNANAISEEKNNRKTITSSSQKAIAESQSAGHRSLKKNRNSKTPTPEIVVEKSTNQVAVNKENTNKSLSENKLVQTETVQNNTNNNTITDNKIINLDDLKGAPNSNSKIVTTEKKVNDTTQMASVATNALEELLNEKESKEKQLPKENRWQITSNVAPVFLGSVSNGSPIGSEFENNPKEYNTSFSMGVGISYAVNTKLSVRTGINKMSVDYNTNGIAFFVDIDNPSVTNISPTLSGKAIHVEDASAPSESLLPFENNFVQKNEGYMNQKMGYYEVPVELTYALINKRFGVKIIGGVSTFFLNENKISLVSENMSTDLGKANNLNDVHFSTNLGLGIKYGFLKSFEFNVEPTLKYQLNTFSENAGNFKPYVFGIYSGISYKF